MGEIDDAIDALASDWDRTKLRVIDRANDGVPSDCPGIDPDTAPCEACLRDLFDPTSRRYRYAFASCSQCGPRYTITRSLPRERGKTSMFDFPMCAACVRELESASNGSLDAALTSCPQCGPALTMPVEEIVARLVDGEIIAVKGTGGFQLLCDAMNAEAVARLRQRTLRDARPLAVMFASAASAERHVMLSEGEARLLVAPGRPMVLARRRRDDSLLAASIAPDLAWLGVMLPSSALLYLLFHEQAGRPEGVDWLRASCLSLVTTAAKRDAAPLIASDDEAAAHLQRIADSIAGHNRSIAVRCEESIVRVVSGGPVFLRLGRGTVPRKVPMWRSVPPLLATGGYIKSAVCVTRGDGAYISQHIGDLDDAETCRSFEETVAHLCSLLGVSPGAVAHDLHPEFPSSRFARTLGIPALAVQHHHAHIAAVLAEHHCEGEQLGLALDGVGLGTDGGWWGGELLSVDGDACLRLGHLLPLALPGGDRASGEPWRMASAVLHKLGRDREVVLRFGVPGEALLAVMDDEALSPLTTACGRWFDAAAALLGIRETVTYEAEAPMVLESLVRAPRVFSAGWGIRDGVLDLLPLFDALVGMDAQRGSELFHGTLAAALVELAMPHIKANRVIALGGGCIANAVLVSELQQGFDKNGVDVLLPKLAPVGDGGLALGQAWVLAHSILAGRHAFGAAGMSEGAGRAPPRLRPAS